MRSNAIPKEDIKKIAEMAGKGIRATEIGKVFGRSGKTISGVLKRIGAPTQPRPKFPKGQENPSWRGGQYFDADGYICELAHGHPFARGKGYVRQHRLVMERVLGRYLTESEVVHHKDGDKANNHPSNLELFSKNSDHLRHELTGRIPAWTEEGKRRILEAVRKPRNRSITGR